MKKEKKITIKFFLNKNLQSKYYYSEGSKKPQLTYPLYIQVTYNRKNTQFKSFYGEYYTDLSKVDQQNVGGPGVLKFEEKLIRKTIQYEINRLGERFDLKGISEKYEKYCQALETVLNQYLKGKLRMILFKTAPYEYANIFNYNDEKIDVLLLYKIAKKIYERFEVNVPKEFIETVKVYEDFTKLYFDSRFSYNDTFTVADWLEGSAKADFEEKLKKIYKVNKHKVAESIKKIEKIVQSVIEA